MSYKVVIEKCEDSHRAEFVADEIAKWSGVAKETVFNALVNKSVCIRMETDKNEALELKKRFEAVGASVRMIEYGGVSTFAPKGTLENKVEDEDRKVESSEKVTEQLKNIKTDIVIFGKKDGGNTETSDKKERVTKTERNENRPNKRKKRQNKSKSAKMKSQYLGDKLITSKYRDEYIKELFRSLRTKVLMGLHDCTDKSLIVTSLDADTGKSTIAANIAISIAQQNKKTLLIDGDLKRGIVHKFFNLEQSPGLSDFMISESEISEEPVNTFIKETHVPDLFVITSGENVTNSSDLLTSDRFLQLKKIVSNRFEVVILDTPPLGAVTDAVVVNELFSKYLFIVKAGITNVVDMKKKIHEYPALKEKVLGLVLNFAAVDKIRSYYKHSKYY